MSFLSQLFRKAPAPSPDPAPVQAEPTAADRAQAAAAEESALRSAIDARDVQAVARFVVAGTSTKVRQAAAHAIEDPEVLRQLIRDVRGGNDKSVYKVLTAKRDALLEQARKLEQTRADIDAASSDLERHSQRAYDATFSARLEQYERRWNVVAAQADPELRGKVQQWIERAREIVAEHARKIADQASREQAAADAAVEARRRREEEAQASAAAAAEQAQALEEQKRARAEQAEARQQAVRQIEDLIRKARAALGDGSTSRAAGMRRTIEEKLASASPLPANLAGQIQQLDQQLDELKDWKSFSVGPKRAELIEAMEVLIGAPFDPPALAEKIKNLQEEWRTLSRGASEGYEADWQRFQAAGQQAYQPCKAYFAEQALIREKNLERREALIAKLTAFEAGHPWEQPDWRAVTNLLRDAKQEWRRCSPVERKAGKEQEKRFVAISASLEGLVDAEHARNVRQKESLIEHARQQLAGDDARKAIEAIKALQQQWQSVGPVPREIDQRLWGQFREQCDAVFQKRQQESAAYAATLEGNKTQAVALCEQVEKIAALEGAELLAGARTLPELRQAFEALGELPRADTRELRNRFDRGLERCERSVARQHARDAEHSWSDLLEAANHVRAYRLALARGLDAAQVDALKKAAETFMANVQRWPKGGLDILKRSLAGEGSADPAANEKALRTLCIRAEIVTDTPTPTGDQPLRREYQLQRLAQTMGQGLKADETQLDAMALEWVGVGPVEDATYQPLVQRFLRCRERRRAS